MLSGFIPLLRNFEIKDSATENFCLATYLPEELTHKSGTTFCLIEVEKGEGTVFRSGVPYEVTAPAFWVASPLDVYTFGGSEEWTLHAMVLNGRLFESIYTDLPGESALELWRRLTEVGTVWTSAFTGYEELVTLRNLMKSISESEESEFLAVSYIWQMTAILRRLMVPVSRATLRARPPRRLLGTLRYMQDNYSSKITLTELAKTASMSVSNFSAVFRRTFGMAPMEYLLQLRLRHAAYLLQHTEEKIITIAEECGFFSNSNFIKAFTRMAGQTPSEYRKSARARQKEN